MGRRESTAATWGSLTSASERIPNANGWVNPYRFDGRDGVRYDASTGLDWMSVRAYDPSVGRFLSRDPLGRAPLFFADNPYVYAGANPLSNVDPSGQYRVAGFGSKVHESWKATKKHMAQVARMKSAPGKPTATTTTSGPMVLTALAGTSPACDSIDVPCLLSHLDLSKVNWGEVAQGAVSYLGGTASLAAGMAALGGLLTNPEAFFAEAALVTLFGGTPATAFFAIFALITAGLSFMVHALATVLSGLGIMNGMLASLFTLVEMGVDALAVAFGTATLATTAEGLFTGLAGVAATFIGLGDNHNDYG